jgi:tetratricopeptide (TPR) repeat protein
MSRTYVINSIIKHINATKYLEIGISDGNNFKNIKCDYKIGVDPEVSSPATLHLTSDAFFSNNEETFDVIFIDGLHHSDQVERDILNSLNVLNENGIILCHDVLPTSYEQQTLPFISGKWTGDVWKAFVKFRQTREDLKMFTIDVETGIGIIMKGKQELLVINEELNYKNFEKRKFEWVELLPLNKFYTDILQTDSYSNLLQQYINNPESDLLNFYLAVEYDKMGQTAAAISFYLRAAERTDEDLLKYECLLRASMCFDAQGSRGNSVIGLLQHAVSLLPKRPEAYFLLSRYYERTQKWFEGYMLASIGEKVVDETLCKLRTVVDYPGYYGLLFEKAVTGWWCGLCEESLGILKKLSLEYPMDKPHLDAVANNLKNLGGWKKSDEFISFLKTKEQELEISQRDLTLYTKDSLNNFKFEFKGLKNLQRNYSEAFQDMFVLTLLDGKKEGYYLEVGAGFPFYGNNT